MSSSKKGIVSLLQEFSIPLLAGVVVALLAANLNPVWYEHALHWTPFGHVELLGHELTLHFIFNDIFMVFFFGIAAKEITESCHPGGSLNPVRKALSPLLATIGGVVGPVLVFLIGLWLAFQLGVYQVGVHDEAMLRRGWGVPTATDIALAWLVARSVFGAGHPAVAFLLLLAVADDAIGLVIIAVFYGDPAVPAEPLFLGMVGLGMAIAYLFRRLHVKQWWIYVGVAGPISWSGLILAHLHPALALAVIIPFLPGPQRDTGMFVLEDEVDQAGPEVSQVLHLRHSTLHSFEHQTKLFVDFGLFFFAFSNAGVQFAGMGPMTVLILVGLIVGKTVGIVLSGLLGICIGLPLPGGMRVRDLAMAGFIAALGLTVALFVAAAAFVEPALQGEAKMGALLSGLVGIVAVAIGRVVSFKLPEGAADAAAQAGDAGVTPAESGSGTLPG